MGLKNLMGQGPNYVPAYQTSGTPFVTSSVARSRNAGPDRIDFPYVTKNITIRNTGDEDLRIAFTFSGSYAQGETVRGGGTKAVWSGIQPYQGDNYFVLPSSGSSDNPQVTLDARCTHVFLMSDKDISPTSFSLYAGLAGIDPSQFPVLTASNGFQGIG